MDVSEDREDRKNSEDRIGGKEGRREGGKEGRRERYEI